MTSDLERDARRREPPWKTRGSPSRQQVSQRRLDRSLLAEDAPRGLLERSLDEVAVQRGVEPAALREHITREAVEHLALPSAEVIAQRQELDMLVGAVVRELVLLALRGDAVRPLREQHVPDAEC